MALLCRSAGAAFGSALLAIAGFRFERTARVERVVVLAVCSTLTTVRALGFFMMDFGSSFGAGFLSLVTLVFGCAFAMVFGGASSAVFEVVFVNRAGFTGSAIWTFFRAGLASSVFAFGSSMAAGRPLAVEVAPAALVRLGFAAAAGTSSTAGLDFDRV
jgi:hypothetical protein